LDFIQSILFQLSVCTLTVFVNLSPHEVPADEIPLTETVESIEVPPPEKLFTGILSVGAPQLLEAEMSYRLSPRWEGFAQVGYFPLFVGSGTVLTQNFGAGARYQPWERLFFVALSAGYQQINYNAPVDFSSFGTDLGLQDSRVGIRSFYVSHTVGFLWRKASGFMIGFDVGVGIPIVSSGAIDVNGEVQLLLRLTPLLRTHSDILLIWCCREFTLSA